LSNYLAISAVTAVLKYILERELPEELDESSLRITIKPPHLLNTLVDLSGLNIFLYQISLNSGYINQDQPRRDTRGRLISSPLVGVDLHYLLTPFSSDNNELLNQQILASAMRILQENPVLTREIIGEAFESIRQINHSDPILKSDIASQRENIRIVYKPLSLDEISKILFSNIQTNYRLSITYLVTVVLISSKVEPLHALPVQKRKILVKQYNAPVIEYIEPDIVPWDSNADKMKIKIIGKDLISDKIRVVIGELEILPDFISVNSSKEISVNLPADLPAGIKTLRVIHGLYDDTSVDGRDPINNSISDQEHLAFKSNTAYFAFLPKIITEFPLQVTRGVNLKLDLMPPVEKKQKVEIIIGEQRFNQKLDENDTFPVTTLQIKTDNFPLGKSLFRLRIDEGESLLLADQDPTSNTFGKYIGPEIEVITQ